MGLTQKTFTTYAYNAREREREYRLRRASVKTSMHNLVNWNEINVCLWNYTATRVDERRRRRSSLIIFANFSISEMARAPQRNEMIEKRERER